MPKAAKSARSKTKRQDVPDASRQVAALPYRVHMSGAIEILVITSRQTGRFIIPKGWPKKSVPDFKSAATEAFEEAGIAGKPRHKPIGSYVYWKRLEDRFDLVSVDVYPIEVKEHHDIWPEKGQRKMAWLPVEDAASLIDETVLAELVRSFKP